VFCNGYVACSGGGSFGGRKISGHDTRSGRPQKSAVLDLGVGDMVRFETVGCGLLRKSFSKNPKDLESKSFLHGQPAVMAAVPAQRSKLGTMKKKGHLQLWQSGLDENGRRRWTARFRTIPLRSSCPWRLSLLTFHCFPKNSARDGRSRCWKLQSPTLAKYWRFAKGSHTLAERSGPSAPASC